MSDARDAERLEIALGALADIALSKDMTLGIARRKAKRIYDELTAGNLEQHRDRLSSARLPLPERK